MFDCCTTLDDVLDNFLAATDSCEVTTVDLSAFDPSVFLDNPDLLIPDLESASISAGEILTVLSPAGTFVELNRVSFDNEIAYELEENSLLPGSIPANAVVNIPGDVFPAFNDVAILAVEEIANFTPSTGPIPATATFTWTPTSASAQSFMTLGLVTDFSMINDSFSSVTCSIVDDGSFTLPTDIQAQLGADFQAGNLAVSRTSVNTVISGNAAVIVTTVSII